MAIGADHGGSHRHARDFSLKVAPKPVMKTGAGAGVAADDASGADARDRVKIRIWSPYKFRT
jgi:hypothetical protein